MSRLHPWRHRASDSEKAVLTSLSTTRLYLVHQRGPLRFVIRQQQQTLPPQQHGDEYTEQDSDNTRSPSASPSLARTYDVTVRHEPSLFMRVRGGSRHSALRSTSHLS